MTHSPDLFELVQSLTPGEKRYFRKYVNGLGSGRGKSHLMLFNAIERQKNPDEKSLRSLINVRYYSREKNYLYHVLLKSLGSFHYETDMEIRVNGMFNSIRILFNRGLLAHCSRKLDKIGKLIDKNRLTAHRQEWLHWKDRIALARADIRSIRENKKTREDNEKRLENLNSYIQLYADLYALNMQSGTELSGKDRKWMQQFLRSPLLQNEQKAITVQAKLYFHHIHSVAQSLRGEQKLALHHSLRRLELLEKHPECMRADPQQYINAINNHVEGLVMMQEYKEAIHYVHRLQYSEFGSPFLEARKFVRVSLLAQMIHRKQNAHEKNVHSARVLEEGLWRFSELVRVDEQMQLCFFMAHSYFKLGKLREALRWVNKVLNLSADVKIDFQIAVRLLNLVIHYELGNLDHLASVLNSSSHFIRQKERSFRYEKVFIEFIRVKLLHRFDRKELLEAFTGFKRDLNTISRNPSEKTALEYFDFMSWVDEKIALLTRGV